MSIPTIRFERKHPSRTSRFFLIVSPLRLLHIGALVVHVKLWDCFHLNIYLKINLKTFHKEI